MKPHRSATTVPLLFFLALLGGCTSLGAPSFDLFGAYFPAWVFCALIGIIGGIIARVVFLVTRVADALPYQLPVCTAIALIVALSVWLLGFR
jgi:hypothetical protein